MHLVNDEISYLFEVRNVHWKFIRRKGTMMAVSSRNWSPQNLYWKVGCV